MFEAEQNLGAHRWHVIRLLPRTTTEVVILSERFFALTTHWIGHTVPCPGEDCALCDQVAARGMFYLAVAFGGRTMLLEMSSVSASHLEQHAKLLHGGLRPGLEVRCKRSAPKQPVHSEILGFREGAKSVPQIILAQRVLAIYKFPPANPNEDLGSYERRCRLMAVVRNRRLAADASKSLVS